MHTYTIRKTFLIVVVNSGEDEFTVHYILCSCNIHPKWTPSVENLLKISIKPRRQFSLYRNQTTFVTGRNYDDLNISFEF